MLIKNHLPHLKENIKNANEKPFSILENIKIKKNYK